MELLSCMQPRDPRPAARSVSVLAAVAAAVTIVAAPLQHGSDAVAAPGLVAAAALVGGVVALSIVSRRFTAEHRVAWALGPLLGVVAVTAIDLLTDDASVSAQIFFLFPVLYGASQLRPAGAAVVAAAAVAGEIVVVGTQLPLRQAVVEAGYVTAALVTTSVLLTVASERHARLVSRLEQLAAVDPLTGLATRRVLDEAASSALMGAGSEAGTALLLMDVDHFKAINDRHGHPAGDEVLIQIARLLREHSRESDVVCRLGGDEIAVLMTACAEDVALARAEEILAAVLARPFRLADGELLAVSVSMGCAHLPTHATDLRALYSAADAALYEAKQAGRGRLRRAPTALAP
ncbi:GGDEF domain-containing protein [Nocardioides sp. SYSU DS0651]|uniref:GGDEF domain-containing protein n=1 Tax=Nocardioides sp. SYSU DS0651 TaxID=3415955 RepID=UPI003F4B2189